jgi:HK97 family phage major capsid protein
MTPETKALADLITAGNTKTTELVEGLATRHRQMEVSVKERDDAIKAKNEKTEALATKAASEISAQHKEMEALQAQIKSLVEGSDAYKKRIDELEAKRAPGSFGGSGEDQSKSIARQIRDHREMEEYRLKDGNYGVSIQLKGSDYMERKGLTSVGTQHDRFIQEQRKPGVLIDPPNRRTLVRDVIPNVPTTSDTVEWQVETTFNAQGDPEGTIDSPLINPGNPQFFGEGEAMSKAQWRSLKKSSGVKWIGHLMDVSEQMLMDDARMEAFLSNRMRFAVDHKIDRQILLGAGGGNDLLGIMNSGIQTYDWETGGEATDTQIDAVRRGVEQAEVLEYQVDALMMNRQTWNATAYVKDQDGRYILTFDQSNTPIPRLHSLPVIITQVLPTNTILAGAFQTGVEVATRMQQQLLISRENRDNIENNVATIRVRERLALPVYTPKAFVNIDVSTPPASP